MYNSEYLKVKYKFKVLFGFVISLSYEKDTGTCLVFFLLKDFV